MKLYLLSVLACPVCQKELEFGSLKEFPRAHEEIKEGLLRCKSCGRAYPIVDSIPQLRLDPDMGSPSRTRVSFGWEWKRYPGSRDTDKGTFLEETQTEPHQWKDKFVLDAGCGMGRYTMVALSLGAEVVAFDLSDSIHRLIPAVRENPKLHLVQGDLLYPPFKTTVFDVIYSQGVIHHTSNTRIAFNRISQLAKRDGLLSVWVYGTPGSYKSFSTNPLRSKRKWLRSIMPLLWVLVWIRQIFSDILRVFTTRMPVPLLYALCYPLTMLGVIPIIKYFTFSVDPVFKVRLIENFDWLAPPYQTKHTKEEFREWYASAGYSVLKHLPHGVVPKIGILGQRLAK